MDSKKSENIVAYLDGELNDDQAAEVDRMLTDDGAARQQVEQYSRTWDMLDLLPSSQASDGLAERTLTAIRSGQAETIDEQALDTVQSDGADSPNLIRRIAIRAVAFFGLFLVGMIGFHSNFGEGAEPIDQLLKELPMLERLDEYDEAESIEFLQNLERSGVFRERH